MIESSLKDAHARTRVDIAACSFDVFDTFLLRACTAPDGVFERAFQLSPVGQRHPDALASYVQHRIQAEARARKAAKDARGSFEVTIADIYACFPLRLFGLARSALPDLIDAEFRAEIDLCRINQEMLRLYREAQRAGRRVGFISDTYWSAAQIGALLRHREPDLTWDFLYTSSDHGTAKGDRLFARYLADERLDPDVALHIGDNETADIKGAQRHGIRARFYPQASESFAARLQRESSIFDLLCGSGCARLDHGLRTLRRVVSAQAPERSAAFRLGVTTLGPAMMAFDAFVARRAERLRRDGGRIAVAFLGRDGFLSHRLWQALREDPASYIEINRRVSLIGSATTLEPLVELFSKVTRIDAPTFAEIVKISPPSVSHFFSRFPGGICSGRELADALPHLVEESRISDIAAAMRKALLAYLRHAIPDFDRCTDLVIADLGYSGSVQKALRRILDLEGVTIRLHGAYLMTLDDALDELADDDTAEGFISDLVVTPHAKRMLIRNIALLEQMCCSSSGSVRDYRGAEVLREINPRPPEQLALAEDIQSGALAFARSARELAPRYGFDPFAAPDVAARWATAILGRLLLLPDDDELVLLGPLRHDVNLGTQALAPMVDGAMVRHQIIARGFAAACTAPAPPMWLAGSFACLSPSHAYLYTLFGANRLSADVFGEARCGEVRIGLFTANGGATMETVSCHRNGFGELRIRVPVSRAMNVRTIAVSLAGVAPQGLLQGVTVQTGKTLRKAARNPEVAGLPDDRMTVAGLALSGRHYRATDDDGCLLITVDPMDDAVAIFTVAVAPAGGERILSVLDRDAADDRFAATLFGRDIRDAAE